MATPTKKLQDDCLYISHDGQITCGAHAGMTAQYTGRSLGGGKLRPVSASVVKEFRQAGFDVRCERPGCQVRVTEGQ